MYIDSVSLAKEIPPEAYFRTLPAIQYLVSHPIIFDRDVTFFVGENGKGKSTLIEAIAVADGFNAEGGTRNFCFSTNQTHSKLFEYLTISRTAHAKDGFFLRAESFYNVATNIDDMDREDSFGPPVINSYGGISLHEQSHGESFLALVQNRFGGNGLYILDEPEAALSPLKLLTLLAEIDRLVQNRSQFLIATHSPILMAFPNARIYQMTEKGIVAVSYQETEHYQLTKSFLENPERIFRYLFSQKD